MDPGHGRVDGVLGPDPRPGIARGLVPDQAIADLTRVVHRVGPFTLAGGEDIRPAVAVDVSQREGHTGHVAVGAVAPRVAVDDVRGPGALRRAAAATVGALEPCDLVLAAAGEQGDDDRDTAAVDEQLAGAGALSAAADVDEGPGLRR